MRRYLNHLVFAVASFATAIVLARCGDGKHTTNTYVQSARPIVYKVQFVGVQPFRGSGCRTYEVWDNNMPLNAFSFTDCDGTIVPPYNVH